MEKFIENLKNSIEKSDMTIKDFNNPKEKSDLNYDSVFDGKNNNLSDIKERINEKKAQGLDYSPVYEKEKLPFDENGNLEPNNEYRINEYIYQTDKEGRIKKVEGNLKLEDGIRNENAQKRVGGKDRRSTDHGGHLIARQFGGSGGIENLVPMKAELNLGEFKKFENSMRKMLEEGKNVDVSIEMKYDKNSKRPSKFYVSYTVDGEKNKKVFDNN